MAHEFQNGEQTEKWPAEDGPSTASDADVEAPTGTGSTDAARVGNAWSPDDSDAPVELAGTPAGPADDAEIDEAEIDEAEIDEAEIDDAEIDDAEIDEAVVGAVRATDATDIYGATSYELDDEDALPQDATNTAAAAVTDETDDDSDDDQNVELRNAGARDIDATTVSITQGGARDVEATTVTINQGGAGRIRADELTISQGGIGLARTDQLTINEGGTAFAVVAETASLDRETSVFLLVAGSTTGDVRPVLDWRAAAAFGAAVALVLALLRRGRR